jgi:hypothetical protein
MVADKGRSVGLRGPFGLPGDAGAIAALSPMPPLTSVPTPLIAGSNSTIGIAAALEMRVELRRERLPISRP